ncbi:sensor histidine kinase [Nocardioides ferulae]|uniref:sensor histidine kinase n=1 Tax=Nocardioides ferulae TaxID=2340821 RepID=UPI000EB0580E|nr:sensor histidine kinase [Nocardioides ferulae]
MTPPAERAQRPASWPVAAAFPFASALCVAVIAALELRIHGEPILWSFGEESTTTYGLGTGLVGLVLGLLSAVILRSAGHRVIGVAMGGTGLFWALDGVSESWVRLALVTEDALPGTTFAVWFLFRFTALLTSTVVLLALIFPTGRFLPGLWGVASWVCMAAMVLSSLSFVLVPYEAQEPGRVDPPPGVDLDPTTVDALAPLLETLSGALQAITVLGLVVPVGVVVHRYRHATGTARDQMRWLLWGVLVVVTVAVVTASIDLGPLNAPVFFLSITVAPAAMTVAVVAPRLVPIDDLLGRTLVLALLALVLVAVDFVAVAGLSALLDDSMEQSQVVLVVLLTTVLLYGPLRQRLSRWVRRRVLGESADPYDAVAGLASTLESTDEGPEQLAAVARAVADAFGVGFVSVEVERSGGERLTATHGTAPDRTRTLPITYRGDHVGRLVLPARGLRSRLSRRDEEVLGDLVRQAATAARTSRLAEELQASRERLVVAREEERRRIRRDLHDGLGPSLGGVVFQLESARLLIDSEPERARRQLAATTALVQDVVADVRRLVHDLRPPALDDRGLVGALRQQAERVEGVRVTVAAGDLGALPAAVEVAAYRIAGEAITNVTRHARARACTVRLSRDADQLLVEVADDGVGIPEDVQAGVGLVSLRERAAELGGRAEVACPDDGGTVVRAWLPVRRGHDGATPEDEG